MKFSFLVVIAVLILHYPLWSQADRSIELWAQADVSKRLSEIERMFVVWLLPHESNQWACVTYGLFPI